MIKGAKWWKFDFHTHTLASSDYKRENYSDRNWLLSHMENEIDCVAITDHNTGARIDELQQELERMKEEKPEGYRPLVIFPGVEISVTGSIHLLALFDPEESSEKVSELMGWTEYSGTHGDSDGVTGRAFTEIVRRINEMNGLAIPAHVDRRSGLLTEKRGLTLEKKVKVDGLLAFELCDLNYSFPQVYTDLQLNHTKIIGSDSHSIDECGSKYTWVKMESPTIDALRLALHDGEDGVLHMDKYPHNPNDHTERFYIKNITINNGAKAGRGNPLQVNFSPWMTTLIGGRGSGKSSVIEYLRLAMTYGDDLPEKLKKEFNDFAKIHTRGEPGMLTNETKITVDFYKDGRDIKLEWKDNEIVEFHLNEKGDWEAQEKSDNIKERFPLRIYSQKQLFELTQDPHMLLNLIDNQFDKREWNEKRQVLEREWLDSRRKERELSYRIQNTSNTRAELRDINAKLKIYENKGNKDVLSEYQSVMMVKKELNNQLKTVKQLLPPVKKLKLRNASINTTELESSLDENSLSIINEVNNELKVFNKKIEEIIYDYEDFLETLQVTINELPWQNHKKDIIQRYTSLTEQLQSTGEDSTQEYEELVKRKQLLIQQIEESEQLQKAFDHQKQSSEKIYQNIVLHEQELRQKRKEVVLHWNENNEDLEIKLVEFGDKELGESTFRNLIRREGNTFSRDIYESGTEGRGLFNRLHKTNPNQWKHREKIIDELLSSTSENPNDYTRPFITHINELKENNPEDIDKVKVWFPEDLIILKLKIGGRAENIDVGSAGQRTAAMLSLLLSIDDSPVIIDQPEDDLDTRMITNLVVKGLRKIKKKQQVIIVTHNPNIPVNGGAEKIVQMHFGNGQIYVDESGALQDKAIREAVCDVMEGGKEALSNRYYRIFKALE